MMFYSTIFSLKTVHFDLHNLIWYSSGSFKFFHFCNPVHIMNTNSKNKAVSKDRPKNRCLSCGTSENMYRRRYCSIECRQRLRYNLNMRTGLLCALNTRYGTFYFTESIIILDVLPYGSGELFSFMFPRSKSKKPVEDFCMMSNILGNAWWAEKQRTNKRYIASRSILERANSKNANSKTIRPIEIKEPARLAKSLTFLKLHKTDLESPELQQVIKKAYRQQAKRHHPDQGGDSATFRKLHEAYQQLVEWSENPVFISRRGFPDKWFYYGSSNRWIQPAPIQVNIF